jgi:C-terminal processing protease CtpA/Prc
MGGGGAQAPTVLRVVPQGPAARAGIREGDLVTHIDGVALAGLSGPQRVDRILGSGRACACSCVRARVS